MLRACSAELRCRLDWPSVCSDLLLQPVSELLSRDLVMAWLAQVAGVAVLVTATLSQWFDVIDNRGCSHPIGQAPLA